MDFELTSDQIQLKQEIINFARENLNEEETLEEFSYEVWKKISEFGLFGLTVPEEYGGLNESFLTAAVAIEALGYACKNNGLVFVINNHIWVALNLINLYGTKELKEKYLADMVCGNRIGAISLTEADAGSDAMNMSSSVSEEKDYYVLNGSKMFISNGPIADLFIVFAVTAVKPFKQITAFVVEKQFPGVVIGKNIEKMGLNACPTSEITFNNVKIPKENILGRKNMGSTLMTNALEWERCYEFAPHVGAMQRIMETSLKYAEDRMQFGQPISRFQAVSHKISEMKIAIELSRLMLYKIAWLKDQGKSAFLEVSIFKTYVSEQYIKTCKNALQIHGAYGYTKEYGIERELRDAIACDIYSGTAEMQKNTIFTMIPSVDNY
ncbi:acyl-CoA dehydrogenase family protein [Anaerocolumna sp. AGMB13025]|uniref:acyl-CoA dehydrogenase family protein n=1 Tax=Anaerocolumna sp. AGMB13025 TaxID=3039116 RepID=UPI00241C32C2|nr:acyl-CoA dehydrogenase family protein [Anaerocolumna sp. AGMB13025]WFR56032.1 acyl-CoA dehydrogenase family protein [Anaerocolumna sp. AGMB13025]